MSRLGSFSLVLHGHMPWVLHHGRWPHGEHWLFEAALGVYLPLLEVIDEVTRKGARTGITLGLTDEIAEMFPSWGPSLQATLISVIVLNQLVGPPLFEHALRGGHVVAHLRCAAHGVLEEPGELQQHREHEPDQLVVEEPDPAALA